MKTKLFGACFAVLIVSSLAYAQTVLDGRWSSDPTEVVDALIAARAASTTTANDGARTSLSSTRSLTTLGGVQMNLSFDGTTVNGSIVQGVTNTRITHGTFDGRIATLKTQRQTESGVLNQTWTIELKDSDTFVLTVDAVVAGAMPNPSGNYIIPVTMHRVR